MNWFTKGYCGDKPLTQKMLEEHDCCEHLTKVGDLVFGHHTENDSFGSESHYSCEACWNATEEHENNIEVCCHDCRQTVLKKNSFEWKWYDFDHRQGDKTITICNDCKDKDKHQKRVKEDKENARLEAEYYGSDSDEYY